MTLISERRATPLVGAIVRSFACMLSQMCLKVSFLVECFVASLIRADEVTLSIMSLNVCFQSTHLAKGLIAAFDWALVLPFVKMELHMVLETLLISERLATVVCLANEGFATL